MVQDGARWCKMVQHGATWCNMVQDGARWRKMAQDGAIWCNMVQDGERWCKMVQHGASWCNMVQHGATWFNMVQHGATWFNMVQHGARGPSSLNCSRKGGQFSEHRESQDLKRDTNQRRAVNCHWIADRPDIHFSKLPCPKQRPPFMSQSIMTPKL